VFAQNFIVRIDENDCIPKQALHGKKKFSLLEDLMAKDTQ
jgi:hypothetical protein